MFAREKKERETGTCAGKFGSRRGGEKERDKAHRLLPLVFVVGEDKKRDSGCMKQAGREGQSLANDDCDINRKK